MRAVLLTYGSRGDVEPFVALACGLRRRGHDVLLACPAPLQDLADAHGLRVLPLPGDPRQLVRGLTGQGLLALPRTVRSVSRFVLPLGMQVMQTLEAGVPEADCVVHSFLMTQAGHALAGRLRAAQASAQLFPVFAPTRDFPSPAFPDLPLGGGYRRLSHRLTEAIFRSGSAVLYRHLRTAHPDLPPSPGWPFTDRDPTPTPILLACSPTLVGPPPDWPPHVHVTGAWRLLPPPGWQPDPRLVAFLEAGSPPIYAGFGSSLPPDTDLGTRLLEAIARVRVRALLDRGWDDLWPEELPPGCMRVASIPHSWLLPRVSLAIHHGGAGTTGAVLHAGIPSVVVPMAADQPFWGRRLVRAGVASASLPPGRASVDTLTSALRAALDDVDLRARAARLGEAVRKEDGVARAVEILEAHVAATRRRRV